MADRCAFSENVLARQCDMFRIAKRDHGLTDKVLAAETGFKLDTITTWTKGTAMPAYALVKLCRIMPDHLTSMMFEPADKYVGTIAPGDGSLDELAREAAEYNVEYLNAHDPKSENGPGLSPREEANLKFKSKRLAAVAQRAG